MYQLASLSFPHPDLCLCNTPVNFVLPLSKLMERGGCQVGKHTFPCVTFFNTSGVPRERLHMFSNNLTKCNA